jgi:hypothetical protein
VTAEHRLIFDFADIRGFGIECQNCSGRLLVPLRPSLPSSLLDNCPFCGADWMAYDNRATTVKQAAQALLTLRSLTDQGGLPMAIKLEYAEPSESPGPASPE